MSTKKLDALKGDDREDFGIAYKVSKGFFDGNDHKFMTVLRWKIAGETSFLFLYSRRGVSVLFFENEVDKCRFLLKSPPTWLLTD